LLRLHVASLNAEADVIFNYNLERPNNSNNLPDLVSNSSIKTESSSISGYLVDHNGYIHLPLIDTVKLVGSTIDQASQLVEDKLQQVLSKPIVSIQFENLKVSVLGDVSKPDTYYFQDEKITLNQVLSYAGDLNITGIRNNVLLIRELNGNRQYIPLDLTSKKIFSSPFYYLKNNDIIYVQPNRRKILSTENSLQGIALIISAISLAVYLNRK
jgi:polysaccharide export outer membrane protein